MTQGMHVRTLAAALLLPLAACAGTQDASTDTTAMGVTAAAPATTTGATAAAGTTAQPAGGLLDPNAATREQLLAVPGMTAPAADALVAGRPYADMLAVDRALAAQVADTAARRALYNHLWKPIDLNAASGDEMLLIPGVGTRMRREFMEYRPYNNIEKFRREIGKYVDADEVARLERYVSIR